MYYRKPHIHIAKPIRHGGKIISSTRRKLGVTELALLRLLSDGCSRDELLKAVNEDDTALNQALANLSHRLHHLGFTIDKQVIYSIPGDQAEKLKDIFNI